jgi:hypothetical protein
MLHASLQIQLKRFSFNYFNPNAYTDVSQMSRTISYSTVFLMMMSARLLIFLK